ncbi:hypothetical protein KR074_001714 [Drosophila pseudoananassae]|nr:hypothetical protein KR074_001714 [Drosophila pseudoananassae]
MNLIKSNSCHVSRGLKHCSPLLRQLQIQKPLMQTRIPLKLAVREMAAKDPKGESKGGAGNGPAIVGPGGNVITPPVTLKIIPARDPLKLGYDDRNMILGRALAPHLTIYKLQLTSGLSICLRISGFVLGVFVWALGISGLFCQGNMEGFLTKLQDCDCATLLTLSKVMVAIPFAYHLVAGTRHLIWYLNVFTSISEVYATGYVAMVLAVLVAVGLMKAQSSEPEPEVVDLTKGKKGQKVDPKKNAKPDPKKPDPKAKGKADPKKDPKKQDSK